MKTAVITSALLLATSTLTVATPMPTKGKDRGSWGGQPSPFHFTSTYAIIATPDQVYNGTVNTPGEPGAIGYYNFGINSEQDVICYNITLYGVSGAYQSPAKTATHIHQADKAASGPPRLAFPNPEGDDYYRNSVGCLKGPFTTGVLSDGVDTSAGFMVKQIEDDPSNFFCDSHTTKYVPGVVRGQLA